MVTILTMVVAKAPSAATDLFIFAGAGVSMSMPTSLPLFNWMRDAVLEQLGFSDYVLRDRGAKRTDRHKIVQDMAPEPFFGRLTDAGVDLSSWLVDVLEPGNARPNAAHYALAELCAKGAKVWTVNFDPFIEEAARALHQRLEAVAWPRELQPQHMVGELLKPHGSLDGRIIITPADVLKPLSEAWLRRLKADLVDSTHVVFVGYSGRDVDFQNTWRTVITGGQQVLWFDRPECDREHMSRVLDSVPFVRFPASQAHRNRDGQVTYNPSWDFVRWCRENRLVTLVDNNKQASLLNDRILRAWPALPRSGPIVQARFAETLGDARRNRQLLLRAARNPTRWPPVAKSLTRSWMNTPCTTARLATSAWCLIPSIPLITRWRQRLLHYQLVQLFNIGNHARVLELTDRLKRRGDLSDALLGLRWGSQKMLGAIADVINEAGNAAKDGHSTNNAVRCVAIFHWCHSLVWAGRYEELWSALQSYFRPIAMITDSRWMAWADYIESCLFLADDGRRDVKRALALLDNAIARFAAEAHDTGLVDVRTFS
jgi:SIR2-like domain